MLMAITNLYPRPDQPTRAMFNYQLFQGLVEAMRPASHGYSGTGDTGYGMREAGGRFRNVVLVPEWRIWRWPAIRRGQAPGQGPDNRPQTTDDRPKTEDRRPQDTDSLSTVHCPPSTVYLPVFYLPLLGRSINWWFYWRALRRHPASRLPPPASDVGILASWLYPDGVAAARLARDLGVPVWLRVHGTDRYHMRSRWRRRLILDAVEYARGVICNCRAVADDLVRYGIPADKVHVVPNGVDSTLFRVRSGEEVIGYQSSVIGNTCHQEPVTNSYPKVATGRTILFVGNLVPIKGPDIMLRAFAALVKGVGVRPQTSDIRHQATNRREEDFTTKFTPLRPALRDYAGQAKDAKEKKKEESRAGSALGSSLGVLGELRGKGISDSAEDGAAVSSFAPLRLRVRPSSSSESSVFGLRSDVSLLVIGTGPMRSKLERMARDLGIADRVSFLGSRPHAEVARWMNVADVLCLTSRSEGMPNVVVEALASGLPVVATDVGACRELLADEPEARLCRSEDEEGIAAALAEVLRKDVDRVSISGRCAGRYSWRRAAERILALVRGAG